MSTSDLACGVTAALNFLLTSLENWSHIIKKLCVQSKLGKDIQRRVLHEFLWNNAIWKAGKIIKMQLWDIKSVATCSSCSSPGASVMLVSHSSWFSGCTWFPSHGWRLKNPPYSTNWHRDTSCSHSQYHGLGHPCAVGCQELAPHPLILSSLTTSWHLALAAHTLTG